MILRRYIIRETLLTGGSVATLLVIIFLSNQFIRFLSQIAAGKLAVSVLLKLIILEVPFLFGYLLPIGMFFGILLALGRLYVDNEMFALFSFGMGERDILKTLLLGAIPVVVVVALLVCWIGPMVMRYQQQAMSMQASELLLQTLVPGRFQILNNANDIVYVEKLSRDRQNLQNVFIAQLQKMPGDKNSELQWSITSAQLAHQNLNEQGDHLLEALNGYRYNGLAGNDNFQILSFKRLTLKLPEQPLETSWREKALPLLTLWQEKKHHLSYEAEWQWRISMPFSVFLLTFLALPLARIQPREGKFAKILPAALLYILYANMLFVARGWIENGSLSPTIGLWAIHIPLAILALILFIAPSMKRHRRHSA